jgi:hypothetical protein
MTIMLALRDKLRAAKLPSGQIYSIIHRAGRQSDYQTTNTSACSYAAMIAGNEGGERKHS